jgi:hypothetical protein
MPTQGKRLTLIGGAVLATLALTSANAAAMNAPTPAVRPAAANVTSAAGLTASYGAVVVEPQDPGYQYRSMPALQYLSWKDAAGQTRQRFVRSFQISGDNGSLKTRVQYHTGGSLTATANWRPALDLEGRELLNRTEFAKVNNVFRDKSGNTVAIDERVGVSSTYGLVAGRHVSNDGGVHWSTELARISLPAGTRHSCSAGRLFQRVIRLPSGTLVMPYYAAHKVVFDPAYPNDCKHAKAYFASHLLISDDDGVNWRLGGTIFKSDTNTYSESSVARRADGRLIMISRYDVLRDGKNYSRLAYRVTDAAVDSGAELTGATWGLWTAVQVPGAADSDVVQGVAPVLHTMEGGQLMLVFGRPRNKVAYSSNGGVSWSGVHNFYDNLPTGCTTGYLQFPCSALGSSGYMGVAVTSPRTAYVMGDNCHTNWGCAGGYTYPNGRDDKLWITTLSLS